MAIKRLQISLPQELVNRLDDIAEAYYTKRSSLIRKALELHLADINQKRVNLVKSVEKMNFDDAEQLAWSIIRRNRRVLAHRNLHKDKLCHCGKIEKPSLAQITPVRYNRPR